MTRAQLRPFYTAAERAALYSTTYQHDKWEDHKYRVAYTAGLLQAMNPLSVADLSCGDGAVVRGAALSCPLFLGDITPGWQFTGPIEETITQCPPVDVFVCSETLEHVEDPDGLLRAIRGKARRLLLTTPNGEPDVADKNPEHYWHWGEEDIAGMLPAAGWTADSRELYDPPVEDPYYTYQIWRCH